MSAAVSEASTLTRQLWHIAGSGDLEQLDQLVSQGVDVNAGDRAGVTALMRAAYHGQLGMVRALIGYGADPNAKDRSGLSALMMAEHGGHEEIVEALRPLSAKARGTGVSPVNHAQDARATNVSPVNHAQDARATNVSPVNHAQDARATNVSPVNHAQDARATNVSPVNHAQDARATNVSPVNHAQDARATVAAITEGTSSVGGAGTNVSPVNHAQDARATFMDTAAEHDDWESDQISQSARTLHEPPEIWELVHTTQTKPYSPSARPGRIFSARSLVLAVCALIVCSGGVFGFLALRGAMKAADDTSEQRSKATALKQTSSLDEQLSNSKSHTKASGKSGRSANELTKLKPGAELSDERLDAPAIASPVSSAKKGSVNQRPKATKVSATVPKQRKNVRGATKLSSEQDASAKSAKKEPIPARDPVKPSTTQKPKVIQWP
jgi:ankyrin repeat protein